MLLLGQYSSRFSDFFNSLDSDVIIQIEGILCAYSGQILIPKIFVLFQIPAGPHQPSILLNKPDLCSNLDLVGIQILAGHFVCQFRANIFDRCLNRNTIRSPSASNAIKITIIFKSHRIIFCAESRLQWGWGILCANCVQFLPNPPPPPKSINFILPKFR